MKRMLRKFFPSKTRTDRAKMRAGKPANRPMILSFDGRVVRLHLPD